MKVAYGASQDAEAAYPTSISLMQRLTSSNNPLHPFLLLCLMLMGGMELILSRSTQAYEVQIQPDNPQLGDTIVVTVEAESPQSKKPPVVVMDGQEFPSFETSKASEFRALLPTSPLDRADGGAHGQRLSVQVVGEEKTRNLLVWLRNRWFRTQYITLPPGKTNLGTDYEFDLVDAFKQRVTPKKFWSGALLRPNSGYVSTEYGLRRYYNGVFAQNYYHRGIDYAAPTGSPIISPAAGQVALVGRESDGFEIHGNTVGIDHGQGVLGIFIHMSRIDVKEGDFVQAGQKIGTVGSTGASTGPHLHWGLYVHGIAVDPLPWLRQAIQ